MHALFALFLIFVVIFYQVVDYAISWISSLCASVCICVYSFLLLILLLRIQCYLCFWYRLCCCSLHCMTMTIDGMVSFAIVQCV